MKTFFSNPTAQYISKKKEINYAIKKVLNSSNYILGKNVKKFENDFSDFIGTKHSIGVANGTDAIEIALKAIDISKGDEVISVSHTALASIAGIILAGAKPVLVDVNKDDFTIKVEDIKKNINKKTKAILVVHIYGQSANMDAIIKLSKKYNIKVIEDVSQAHGGKFKNKFLGSFGDLSTFSFYPTKNLGAIGDAGAICTNNLKFAEKIKKIREYGWNKKRLADINGRNSRLDEIQAAILRIKLKYLKADIKKRQNIASIYKNTIKNKNIIHPKIFKLEDHAFHLYVIKTKKRNDLLKFLRDNKIVCGIHYPKPIHLQPGYKKKIIVRDQLRNTESLSKEIISLPIYPELKISKVKRISKLINYYFDRLD